MPRITGISVMDRRRFRARRAGNDDLIAAPLPVEEPALSSAGRRTGPVLCRSKNRPYPLPEPHWGVRGRVEMP